MAVRKAKPKPPPAPDVRIVADRVTRARAANPPRDPTGEHHGAIAELARLVGRDVVELLDWWDERAAVLEYEGEADRRVSERRAYEDLAEIVIRQRSLLP